MALLLTPVSCCALCLLRYKTCAPSCVHQQYDEAFRHCARPLELQDGTTYEPDWDETRKAFLRFQTAVLLPYRKCLSYFPGDAQHKKFNVRSHSA